MGVYGGLRGFMGVLWGLWGFMGFYGGLQGVMGFMGVYRGLRGFIGVPLINGGSDRGFEGFMGFRRDEGRIGVFEVFYGRLQGCFTGVFEGIRVAAGKSA